MIGLSWHDPAPFQPEDTLGNALLCPTKIYVANLMPLVKSGLLKVIKQKQERPEKGQIESEIEIEIGIEIEIELETEDKSELGRSICIMFIYFISLAEM